SSDVCSSDLARPERKRTGRRHRLLVERELPAPAGEGAIEQEDAVLAEQPVRIRGGNQLELEERGDHVLPALGRLFFGDPRLLRLQIALHLQEAQQRE